MRAHRHLAAAALYSDRRQGHVALHRARHACLDSFPRTRQARNAERTSRVPARRSGASHAAQRSYEGKRKVHPLNVNRCLDEEELEGARHVTAGRRAGEQSPKDTRTHANTDVHGRTLPSTEMQTHKDTYTTVLHVHRRRLPYTTVHHHPQPTIHRHTTPFTAIHLCVPPSLHPAKTPNTPHEALLSIAPRVDDAHRQGPRPPVTHHCLFPSLDALSGRLA
ncbi:hypothetical protein M433DRAFT_5506 [Acidomyces richmondensis BFW]|nr:MAG: hypothetical protein FE78DRAFT_30813 [Acidomyces sp. 'richmondensis']KYG44376.1 hypothetical protein M433DRAFT_5506 [Acidomyces richmondensis BFW]